MSRTHRARLWIPCLLALGLAACGDEGPTPRQGANATPQTPAPDALPPAPRPIQWVHGLAAGVEASGSPDALLFVYVARHRPT